MTVPFILLQGHVLPVVALIKKTERISDRIRVTCEAVEHGVGRGRFDTFAAKFGQFAGVDVLR